MKLALTERQSSLNRSGMMKEACLKMNASARKKEEDFFEYMDKMQETLNKNIQDNVFPNWRQHPSLKGKPYLYKLTMICVQVGKA